MSHNLDGLVTQGMSNLQTLNIKENGNNVKNDIYLYGNSVNAILYASDRKGPCRISFEKLYDIKIYISEKYQDPAADNATWTYLKPVKFIYLQPQDIK